MADTAARSWAARMSDVRRAAILARLTAHVRRHDESVDAVVAAAVALIEAAERGETGTALYAEVGTRGRIHVKPLRPA